MTLAGRLSRRAIVVSSTPPCPADRPRRVRISQIASFLVAEGFAIDLVLYPTDPEFADTAPDPDQASILGSGGSVHVVPPTVPATPGKDGWWDPALDLHLGFLIHRRRYHVMYVGDACLARAFAHAPAGCLTVLDTRSVPSDSTDIPGVADILLVNPPPNPGRSRGTTLITLAAASPVAPRPTSRLPGPTLRVGFIGRDSSLNVVTLRGFLQRLDVLSAEVRRRMTVVAAGTVCRAVRAVPGLVETLGPIASLDAFYGAIDVAVAPFANSPGPRLQVNEALAWGVPLVATQASGGSVRADSVHGLPDLDAVVACLAELATNRGGLGAVAATTHRAAAAVKAAKMEGFATLRRAISARRRRLIILTDVAFWNRGTFVEERGWQCASYFGQRIPVVVLSMDVLRPGVDFSAVSMPPGVDLTTLDVDADVATAVRAIMSRELVAGCLVSFSRADRVAPLGPPVFHDSWPRRAMTSSRPVSIRSVPDLLLDDGTTLPAAALHELPGRFNWRADTDASPLVLVVIEGEAAPSLVDALWHVCPFRLVIFRSQVIATDTDLFANLGALCRPRAIVTIETTTLARELLASLARLAGVPEFHLAGFSYPMLIGGRLIGNLSQHIAAIGSWLRDVDHCPRRADVPRDGWSRLWERVARPPIPRRGRAPPAMSRPEIMA